jgi:monovalent cation:proton antiporter-2 (CPA2) family protein
METASHFKDILIVLGTAGLVIPLLMRWGISSILGYLIIGILLGPDVMGRIAEFLPALKFLAITSNNDISPLAELGVVFLLFLIGLELSYERLTTMRRLVFGLGGLQVLLSTIAIFFALQAFGFDRNAALVLGMALSLSSTAIVIQLYSDAKRLGSQAGRASFAILLMQDLAVIPMLMLVGLMAGRADGSLFGGITQALAQAGLAVALIVLVGRFALRPFLKLVAATRSTDLFMAAVLFIAVGTGALANIAGLSMALGAFIAGLMLAETEYRRAIEAIIEPFKGILLGVFFLLVGLGLDLDTLLKEPIRILIATACLILLKSALTYLLARAFKIGHAAALESGLLLGPGGEFAFVIVATALASGVIARELTTDPLLVVTLSMVLIPLLSWSVSKLRPRLAAPSSAPAQTIDVPAETQPHVIVAGFGRVGSLVASMLEEHNIPMIAVDGDAPVVEAARKSGKPVYFGDAANIELLKKCGIENAKALAVTMDSPARVEDIVKAARKLRPDLKIIARARDDRHAIKLYQSGATEAVPETVESSLQLAEALLVESGIAMGLAIASVHERRDQFRKLLGRPNRREEARSHRKRLKSSMR